MIADELCPTCQRRFKSVRKHHSKNPVCAPCAEEVQEPVHEPDSTSFDDLHFASVLRERAAQMLQHLRYDKGASDSLVDELKPVMAQTRALELDVLRRCIRPLLQPGTEAQFDAALESVSDPSYGLSTIGQELKYAKNHQKLTILEPRIRNLRNPGSAIDFKDVKNHGTVGFSIIETLTRLMQEDESICEHIIASSDKYKSGILHGVASDTFGDVCDGSNFRNHDICRRADDETESVVVRIGIQLYNDGVTVRASSRATHAPQSIRLACMRTQSHHFCPLARLRRWYAQ
jgi:hypothetical protein